MIRATHRLFVGHTERDVAAAQGAFLPKFALLMIGLSGADSLAATAALRGTDAYVDH
jgi:hypothetical protein